MNRLIIKSRMRLRVAVVTDDAAPPLPPVLPVVLPLLVVVLVVAAVAAAVAVALFGRSSRLFFVSVSVSPFSGSAAFYLVSGFEPMTQSAERLKPHGKQEKKRFIWKSVSLEFTGNPLNFCAYATSEKPLKKKTDPLS
jgi:hypothetical protein